MRELLEKHIGKECIVVGANGSVKGTIISVNESALELKLHKKIDRVNIMNMNNIYLVTIL